MPRSLVTGGAGFLGSHLCDSLLASGHEVICLDNLFTGHRDNVRHLQGRKDFTFVEADVVEPFDFKVDFIWNLACPAAPGHYRYKPVSTTMTSVMGTLNCLELGRRTGARVFHASTSEVYGDPEVHPQPESYRGCVNPIGPPATTRASAAPRRSASTTGACTARPSRWCASSTPTARACTPTTGAS
jgi:UDP-glucuronate decarboxylase